tara:strand:+ start:15269 stop:15871 length:603 start_codon:yes stop_codon:yes gene_type:complete
MKPRPSEAPLLTKAREIEHRLSQLEIIKGKCDCPEGKCDCKDCPSCGSKMNKMGNCMKMGCGGKMAKAEPGFKAEKITDVNPAFMAESGGQTKSGYFTTNGKTIETEDAPKKKKGKDATNMEQLSTRMNPHAGGGVDREDAMGESKKLEKASSKALMREMSEQRPVPTICRECGATQQTGCKMPEMMGADLHACPAFKPL